MAPGKLRAPDGRWRAGSRSHGVWVLPLFSMIGLRAGSRVPGNRAVAASSGLARSSPECVGSFLRPHRPGMEVGQDAQSGAASRRRGVAIALIAIGVEDRWLGWWALGWMGRCPFMVRS
jgi:hypothetical protein